MKSISNFVHKLNNRDTKLFPTLPKTFKYFKYAPLAIAIIFAAFFARQILALSIDMSQTSQKISDKQAAIDKGNNQEGWMNESLMSNATSLNIAMAGTIPDTVLAGNTKGWIPTGMIGFTNKAIAATFTPPASGIQYIAQTMDNFIGKPAYAQNGFIGLQGILPLWKGFRNATYVLFSLIFIGIGVALMLRIKISPQAVITIQYAIPKLITALVLVTFSYAIAGLLIDLSYIFQGLIVSIIFNANSGGLSNNNFLIPGISKFTFKDIMTADFFKIYSLAGQMIPASVMVGLSAIIGGVVTVVMTAISGGAGFPVAILLGALSAILVLLIIYIIIFVYLIKFYFAIIKCYIVLLIRIIVSPFEIAAGAIPGSKLNFSSWIWQVVANIAVFPISVIFLLFVNIIISLFNNGVALWTPSIIGGFTGFLAPAIGLSSLVILAKLPNLVLEFVFSIKPNSFGKAIGEGFAPYAKFGEKQVKTAGTDVKNRWMDSKESNTTPGTFDRTKGGKYQQKVWETLHSRDKHH